MNRKTVDSSVNPRIKVGSIVRRRRCSVAEIGRVVGIYVNLHGDVVCDVLWLGGRHSRVRCINLVLTVDPIVSLGGER